MHQCLNQKYMFFTGTVILHVRKQTQSFIEILDLIQTYRMTRTYSGNPDLQDDSVRFRGLFRNWYLSPRFILSPVHRILFVGGSAFVLGCLCLDKSSGTDAWLITSPKWSENLLTPMGTGDSHACVFTEPLLISTKLRILSGWKLITRFLINKP